MLHESSPRGRRLIAVLGWLAASSFLVGCFSCPVSQQGGTGSTATTTPQPATSTPPPGNGVVAKVDAQGARRIIAAAAKIVDVRDSVAFREGHIPGSANIEPGAMYAETRYWNRNTYVLVYSGREGKSGSVADWLVRNGFTSVYVLDGGFEAWDGDWETPQGVVTKSGTQPAAAGPTMYEFSSDT